MISLKHQMPNPTSSTFPILTYLLFPLLFPYPTMTHHLLNIPQSIPNPNTPTNPPNNLNHPANPLNHNPTLNLPPAQKLQLPTISPTQQSQANPTLLKMNFGVPCIHSSMV